MRYIYFLIVILLLISGCKKADIMPLGMLVKEGDIIFQTSLSGQSKAIQAATGSVYSHCGIIYKSNTDYYVYEAIQPIQSTLLSDWIERGKNGHYVIKRLKSAKSGPDRETLARMKVKGRNFNNKDYDLYFEWNDDRIYCSELVWKIYKEGAGIEIGSLQKLSDFNLDVPVVKQKLKERYGNNIPVNEK